MALHQPDWNEHSHALAFELRHPAGEHLYVALSAYWEPLAFALPPLPRGTGWTRIVDTACPSPDDFRAPAQAPRAPGAQVLLAARSSLVLMAQPAP